MMSALKIAATGMQAQQTNVDVLANNISNMNTAAYKRSRASFQDMMYQNKVSVGATTSEAGTQAPNGVQMGLGVSVSNVYKIFEQGSLSETSSAMDVAILGRGFLKVNMPDGTTAYTRDGNLALDADGKMVTADGYEIEPGLTIPGNGLDLTISDTGIVSIKVDGTKTELGQIPLTMFVNEAGLESIGNNLYRVTEASGTAIDTLPGQDGAGLLKQYFVENSNVDPIDSVTEMIAAQRAYELNSRVITTADEMLSAANQIR